MNDNDVPSVTLTPDAALARLIEEAKMLLARREGRVLLGIAGGPGVGKSTLAVQLVEALNAATPGIAAYLPMDGFHMLHKKLEELGTVKDKGAPHTFEAGAFATFLGTVKAAKGPVRAPGYSRKIEDVVQDASIIPAAARIVVVEGNYLLLAAPPWAQVGPQLDRAIFLSVPRDVARTRLLKRHGEEGLFNDERNRRHVESVDLVNFDLVAASRERADLAIDIVSGS
jgi:pantothenate kinase